MRRALVCVLVWTGCAHPSVVVEAPTVEPDVTLNLLAGEMNLDREALCMTGT